MRRKQKLFPGAWHRGLHHAQSAPAEGWQTGTEQMGAALPVISLNARTAGAERCLPGQKCRRGRKMSQNSSPAKMGAAGWGVNLTKAGRWIG